MLSIMMWQRFVYILLFPNLLLTLCFVLSQPLRQENEWVLLPKFKQSFSIHKNASIRVAQPLCQDRERVSLLKFKQSFSLDEDASVRPNARPKTRSWRGGDCCFWDGVECDNVTGHVVGLDLSSSFLHGSIDSNNTLFDLVHLRSLSLSDNDFNYSQIPCAFKHLSKLTFLDLSKSVFSSQIPYEISQLSKLSHLDLSHNVDPLDQEALLELKTPDFRSLIQNLTRLEELNLSSVDMSSTVPDSLSNFSSLRAILLRDCGLKGEFPITIFQLPNLEALSLSLNRYLSGKLPSFELSGRLLKVLDLAGTNFSGKLPSSIEQCSSLAALDVSDCQFSGSIPSSLGKLRKLEFLDLSNNRFTGQIPSSFRNLTQLEHLSLSYNDLSNGTLSWVVNLTKLVHLDLGNSSLTGPVPPLLSSIVSLETVMLQDNDLSGKVDFDIFLSLVNLTVLDLSRNSLEVVTKQSTNRTLPQFTALDLSSCHLKTFPIFLRHQQRMRVLILGDNLIGDRIPKWMLNVSAETLVWIDLQGNFLTGFEKSPVSLPWLTLRFLYLSNNMLNCTLPIPPPSTILFIISNNSLRGKVSSLICNARSLVILEFSNNKLDGELPQCLGNFSNSLFLLNLSNNYFVGEIPFTFVQGNQLRMIDFSNNLFEGKLPRSLANCRMLESLVVGNNQMDDIFPFWLGTLPELRILVLRNNSFRGNIRHHSTDVEFPNLRIIDVSYNRFTGELPSKYVLSWKAMKNSSTGISHYMKSTTTLWKDLGISFSFSYDYTVTITIKGVGRFYEKTQESLAAVDLSNNNFNGRIPEAIGKLKGLISLDLSNNKLSGDIPSSLADLSKLESLDLSGNKLSGEIPQELTNLNFLEYFNVSHNELEGPIPQENQLSRFDSTAYEGNAGLCGIPLPNKCGDSVGPPPLQPSTAEDQAFIGFGWKVVAIGYACGFVAGIFLGIIVVSTRPRWFARNFPVRIPRTARRNRTMRTRN